MTLSFGSFVRKVKVCKKVENESEEPSEGLRAKKRQKTMREFLTGCGDNVTIRKEVKEYSQISDVDGGPSGGSRVRRPGSEDPHRH